MKYLLLALTLIGCSQTHPNTFNIKGFETYYYQFTSDTNIQCNDLIIQFGNTNFACDSDIAIGCCIAAPNQTPIVEVDPNYWSTLPETYRQELIDHELGHCLLHRVHRFDLINGLPASIMWPNNFDGQIVDNNKQYYINELLTIKP